MHAIAVCVMMVGGYIVPEVDITTIPLKDDVGKGISIQDLEWKERALTAHLPQVPTLGIPKQTASDGGPYLPNDRTTSYPRSPYDNSRRPSVIPQSPTEPGNNVVQNPWQPTQGQGASPRMPSAGGGYNSPAAAGPGGNNFSPNAGFANPVGIGAGQYQAQRAVQATPLQTANNYIQNNNGSTYNRQYGSSGPSQVSADQTGKAFSGYQPPSGNSPWNNLYLPTNNGTTNPYTSYVRPAMDQQTFNSHISEQINGVQTQQRGYQGTPGYEAPPMSGPGLVNPNATIDYIVH
jgi:hypothetical protein